MDLRGGATAIDPGFLGLILTQPKKDYTDAELHRIDEFLLRGAKSLVVYASAVNLEAYDPTLTATLDTHGIDRLLDGYGIHIDRDALFDYGTPHELPVNTPEGQSRTLLPPAILHLESTQKNAAERELDPNFPGFFRLDELMLPFASSLQLWPVRQPKDVVLRAVAHTSKEASADSGSPLDMRARSAWDPRPPFARDIVAAVAEGKLRSAFALEPKGAPRSPSPSRVLVVSSSLFVTNPFAYAGNAEGAGTPDPELSPLAQPYSRYLTATILAVKNTLDWMTNEEDIALMSSALAGDPR